MPDKSNDRSLIFAHRGASAEDFENTRSAFDKALTYAIDGIETDVQLSRDRVAVLWHDWTLDKVGLSGKRIGDLDFEQLQAADFSGVVPPVAASDGLLALQAFVQSYHNRCRLLLELKIRQGHSAPERHEALVRQCCDIADDFNRPQSRFTIMINSFDLDSLMHAHRYSPRIPVILNLDTVPATRDVQPVLVEHPFLAGLCLPIADLDKLVVESIRLHGKMVGTFTCNSKEEIIKALTLEVDILITDKPAKALALRSVV